MMNKHLARLVYGVGWSGPALIFTGVILRVEVLADVGIGLLGAFVVLVAVALVSRKHIVR